jgi:hypothetical protein
MPRFVHTAILLGVAAIGAHSASPCLYAQKSPPSSARVQHVLVRGSGASLEVEIQISGDQVAPNTQALTGPDRIVVDFPGALPAAELRALTVNRGALKAIRSGLFFSNPPITRVVLDLAEPQSYTIASAQNSFIVKLGGGSIAGDSNTSTKPEFVMQPARNGTASAAPSRATGHAARLENASLAGGTPNAQRVAVPGPATELASVLLAAPAVPVTEPPASPKPVVVVNFENGMLRIRTERATLAQVLFEVQRQTRAEIAIPAGAEQEEVYADLGPAPARDVLGSLLNGSPYNFIFVGNELTLERVILSRRDPSIF